MAMTTARGKILTTFTTRDVKDVRPVNSCEFEKRTKEEKKVYKV
jgi:hypothetical protein